MSILRHRLLALTCAAATALSMAGAEAAAGRPAPAASPATSLSTSPATGLSADRPGLARLLDAPASLDRAIVTFDARPSAAQVAALRALGLVVQPLRSLPMALVAGDRDTLARTVTSGIGRDVYPDEVLEQYDTASSEAMSSSARAARKLRARGLTGQGVTVGVVDSGCDGTHPDLAEQIDHNVVLLSPEYVNEGTDPALVIPVHESPYDNTDLGSGHGTHVAGIIAADGTSDDARLGVAPDARLACFAIGAVITTSAVVTAFDHMLADPDLLDVDVVNNSWGNSFRQYDPADPVNVATKAVTKRGAVVVFAAGNSGSGNAEASVSPYNQAPWVISVAAGTLDRERGSFSSNGLRFDNGKAKPIGKDGHTVILGDRIGNTQPDVMAPGVDISSSCDSTGTVIGPCPDHGNTSASGTSMASPHVAGAAAVLLQANSRLTPAQVQRALKASATPVFDGMRRLGSHQVGYGHVNLDRAVALVTGKRWAKRLKAASKQSDRRIRRQDGWKVTRADLWQEDAPVVALGGSYSRTHTVKVRPGTKALKVSLVYPTPGTLANLASFVAVVRDDSGKVVGETTTEIGYSTGIASAMVRRLEPGRYTVEVTGEYSVSDPDTIDSDSINGRVVFLQAAQLKRIRG